MGKIIILTRNREEGVVLRKQLASLDEDLGFVPCYVKKDIIDTSSSIGECEYIFSTWYMPEFTDDEVQLLFPNLKAIFYAAGTIKYFAESFLKKGVRVFSAAKANGIPVAEFTVSLIILANKGYFQAQKTYKWPIWREGFKKSRTYSERKCGNFGALVGLLGCGAIGSKVVELLRPYDLTVCVYDPYLPNDRAEALGVRIVELEELFKICDVVSNHLPDIPETKGMIDYSLLSCMKPTATFINTGRGAQVDEKALCKVLKNNKDMCALLDVTSHEPLFPWSPLYWCKNAFLTPHIAGSLSMEKGRMVEYMVKAYKDTLNGIANPCECSLGTISKQSSH